MCSWLATAADIWNGLSANVTLQEEAIGQRTMLIKRCSYSNLYAIDLYCMRFVTVKQ